MVNEHLNWKDYTKQTIFKCKNNAFHYILYFSFIYSSLNYANLAGAELHDLN